jgi:flagellar biosynthesis protein FlhG
MSFGAARRLFRPPVGLPPPAEDGLRRPPEPVPERPLAASLCVASGKGGTGKSVFSASIASCLARLDRVLLLDADLGIGNAHILQGVSPERSLVDVVSGGRGVPEVVTPCGPGLDLVAAGSGVSDMAGLSAFDLERIAEGLARLDPEYAGMLVDSAAGVSRQTLAFAAACDQVVLVTTPDVTAMTDAYAFLKVLLRLRCDLLPLLVVNRARGEADARAVAARMEAVARKFLGRSARFLGWIPEDPAVPAAVNSRAPVVRHAPGAPAALALEALAAAVARELASQVPKGLGRSLLHGRS